MEVLGNLRQTLADNIYRLRKERGWTQHDLAAAAGMSVDALRGYEQKKRWPDPEQIEALAGALESPPWLLVCPPEKMGPEISPDELRTLLDYAVKSEVFRNAVAASLVAVLRDKLNKPD